MTEEELNKFSTNLFWDTDTSDYIVNITMPQGWIRYNQNNKQK
jgi:hypothetical protein